MRRCGKKAIVEMNHDGTHLISQMTFQVESSRFPFDVRQSTALVPRLVLFLVWLAATT